jgi:hypothetical protein
MLDILGMLHIDAAGVRMLSQLPLYFARSLAWFAAHNMPLIDGWRRDSVPLTSQLPRESLFDHAPHVLSALESRRIRLAIEYGLNAEASRDQSAVVVLIRNPESAEPVYLHQFDTRHCWMPQTAKCAKKWVRPRLCRCARASISHCARCMAQTPRW